MRDLNLWPLEWKTNTFPQGPLLQNGIRTLDVQDAFGSLAIILLAAVVVSLIRSWLLIGERSRVRIHLLPNFIFSTSQSKIAHLEKGIENLSFSSDAWCKKSSLK